MTQKRGPPRGGFIFEILIDWLKRLATDGKRKEPNKGHI